MTELAGTSDSNPFSMDISYMKYNNDTLSSNQLTKDERDLFLIGAAVAVSPNIQESPIALAKVCGSDKLRDKIMNDPEILAKIADKFSATILTDSLVRREVLSAMLIKALREDNAEKTIALVEAIEKHEARLTKNLNDRLNKAKIEKEF